MDGRDKAAIARTADADCLPNHRDQLEKEYEEKDHKVETRIIAECFVGWTVPGNKMVGN